MNTASAAPELAPSRAPRPRVGLRAGLALAFGAAAGILCVALSFAVDWLTRDLVQAHAGRYVARMALEYHHRLEDRRELGAARRLREAIEASADPSVPVELLLVAADGTVLAGPAGIEGGRLAAGLALQPRTAVVQRWPDGAQYLVATSGAGPGGWSAVARTRADGVFSAAAVLPRAILWAGLVLALAGMVSGWTLATRHARPLEKLMRAAQEIARGNERIELPPLDDNREVARLADALRAMLSRLRSQAESLRDAQERLQRRVHERTAELVKTQAELELEVADAKLARDELARAHEHLALAMESCGLALFEFDVQAARLRFSAGELVPEQARAELLRGLHAALAGGAQEFHLEHLAAHGRITERDAEGRARRLVGIYHPLP